MEEREQERENESERKRKADHDANNNEQVPRNRRNRSGQRDEAAAERYATSTHVLNAMSNNFPDILNIRDKN